MKQLGKLRKAVNLTQRQLAERLGVKQSTLAMWECGANTTPTKYLIPLSKILNCTVEALLRDSESEG